MHIDHPVFMLFRSTLRAVVLALCLPAVLMAGEIPEGALSNDEIAEIVRQQAVELREQRALLDTQRKIIEQQQQELAAQREALQALRAGPAHASTAVANTPTLQPSPEPVAGTTQGPETTATTTPVTAASNTDEKARVDQVNDDPLLGYDPAVFPGAIQLPDTQARLRIGGYVKANAVQSFEAVGSQDRFIVGSIPTDSDVRGDAEAALTASQSRLNFELREDSEVGQIRAFIEGDFAGDGDSFRLRHAFGQFGYWMAGKTWSTFMDTESSPEELDFEGINGRVNSRRTQLRYFPSLGRQWNMTVAMEDPQVLVLGGDGLSQIPDLVISARRGVQGLLFDDQEWHFKAAALVRSIRARPTPNPEAKDSATGWGLSLSGRTAYTRWDTRDSFMLQLNYGEGYSSYINDLSSVGVPDAAFDPITGKLVAIRALAFYTAFQHWWRDTWRSNLIISSVHVSGEDFTISDEVGDNYDTTWRVSGNLIWSPVPRVNVGGELLWGQRENMDGSSGNATQVQLSAKFLF